jgi:thiosulfate/3-mercaptopyruvate sulfurtransferase
MDFRTLIDPASLARHLDDPNLVVIDCRYQLDDSTWGEGQYEIAHLPGAVYAHLGHDLAGPRTGTNGRHPLPEPGVLAQTLGRLGVGPGVQVVAYDQDNGMYASRLWWLLRWMGHEKAAVLDGGYAAWVGEGRPTRAGAERADAKIFAGSADPSRIVTVDVVERIANGTAPGYLLDARAPERFRGEIEPIDRKPGHIPGAANHFFKNNLDTAGRFLERDRLRASFLEELNGVVPDQVVVYCGSGVTACHNLLALEHAGLAGARLYAGSWSEWSSDDRRPVATGEALK